MVNPAGFRPGSPYRPGSPAGRPHSSGSMHTKVEEELHEMAGIDYDKVTIKHNPSVPVLYEEALTHEVGTVISSAGALCSYSGKKTGRSPKDKRIVEEDVSGKDIWVRTRTSFLVVLFGNLNICLLVGSCEHQDERARVLDQPRACD